MVLPARSRRSRASRRRATALVCAVFLMSSGCYSHTLVGGPGLRELERGGHGQELILRDDRGRAVRVGPNTTLRFLLEDRSLTHRLPARELRVNERGVYRRGELVARWEEIYGAEITNLHGGKSFGAVLGVMLIAGAIVVLIASKGKGLKGLGRTAARVALFTTRVGMMVTPVRRPFPRYRRDPDHIGPPPPPPPSGEQPFTRPSVSPPSPRRPPSGARPAPAAPPPVGEAPATRSPSRRAAAAGPPVPLFSQRLLRSSKLALLGSLEGGGDFTLSGDAATSFLVGLRFSQAFDLAVGARLAILRDTRVAGLPTLTQWIAFGRLAGHFDLDPERWVALAIGADAGGGHPQVYLRLLFGIRFRLGLPWLRLGIYPFNVTWTRRTEAGLTWGHGHGFSFPTTFDLSFTY